VTPETGERGDGRVFAMLRFLLLLAYLPLAHFAGSRSSQLFAAAALATIVLLLLIEPLCAWRARVWAAALAAFALIAVLVMTDLALVPVLLMPVIFIGLIAWWFARSLAPGREPLITRIVSGIYALSGDTLTPRHQSYTRRLTVVWASTLALLATVNLVLAMIAVPDGVLAQFGVAAPQTVTQTQWSLFANVLNYGVVGGLLLVEYHWRKRVFPQRPYRNVVEFAQRMKALGPAFWRDLFR
jgi:uncharacterized membrane protein